MVDVSHPGGRVTDRNVQSVPTVPWRVFGLRRVAHTVDFTDRQIAVLFVVLAAITAIPIVLYPWPPLTDYINHLSRMYVISAVGSDPDLARFYEVDWQVIPNLMMDLVVPPLERVMNIFLAGQVYTIAGPKIAVWAQPRELRAGYAEGSWTPEKIADFLPGTVGTDPMPMLAQLEAMAKAAAAKDRPNA